MLLIFLLIFICLIILGIITVYKFREDGLGVVFIAVGVFALAVTGLLTAIAITNTVKIPQMEERISIYKEENACIEEQIKTAIEVYQDYEKEIFSDIDLEGISSEKLLLMTSVYPELKSDSMVQTQIQLYIDNANAIKNLRLEKFDCELWRWWLCFV